MMVLYKDGTVGYQDIKTISFYEKEIEYCIIDIGNGLKGPMCVLESPKNILDRLNIGEIVITPYASIIDEGCPVDAMELPSIQIQSSDIKGWYSIGPIFEQYADMSSTVLQYMEDGGIYPAVPYVDYQFNDDTYRFATSIFDDTYNGIDKIISGDMKKRFGNSNKKAFANDETLHFSNYITIKGRQWNLCEDNNHANITRRCKAMIDDKVEYVIIGVLPSVAYKLPIEVYLQFETLLDISIDMSSEFEDCVDLMSVSKSGAIDNILALCMSLPNMISIYSKIMSPPPGKLIYPDVNLYSRRVKVPNIQLSLPSSFVAKNNFPLYNILNQMLTEIGGWKEAWMKK